LGEETDMNRKPVILYKTLIVGIIVLFIGVGVQPASSDVSLNTITFSGIIQDMINNASAGETIYIPRGAHYENIVIDKSINLIGEDKNTTVIDGGGFGDVVLIKADWVNFSGFTIQNCGEVWNDAGIFVISNYNNIYNNNIISNDETGIYLFQCSYNTISYNVISNIGWVGIYIVSSDNNIIRNNVINMNNNTGIEIVGSGGNKILSNTISKNEYGTIITL
jgi:nitrous oxidase accessory protein